MTRQEAEAAFTAHVITLAASMEDLDYYQLLGLPRTAKADEVKTAFHRVAKIYHPDAHRHMPEHVRTSLHEVFKRMGEAYRILFDYGRRKRYDAQLAEGGKARMVETKREKKGPRSPDAELKTPAGKRCFLAALQAMKTKNYQNAKLQLQLALTHEGMNSKPVKDKMAELTDLMKKG